MAIVQRLNGVIRDINSTGIHLRLVDLKDNRTYNLGFEEYDLQRELGQEQPIGIGDRVKITVCHDSSGEYRREIKVTPRQPLTEGDYKRLDKMFSLAKK